MSQGVEACLVDVVVQPLRDDAGVVNGIVSFAVDATDVVGQQRRAALSVDGFAAVLDLVPSRVIVVDDHGMIVTMNTAARRIAGVPDTTGSFDGHAIAMFASAHAHDRVVGPSDTLIGRALRGGDDHRCGVHLRVRYTKGPTRVRASIRPLRAPDGDVRGAIVEFAEIARPTLGRR